MTKRWLPAALVVAAVAACGSVERKDLHYTLRLPQTGEAADPIAVDLLVGRLYAPSLYRDTRIVYRHGDHTIGTYEYHRWSEPPADILRHHLLLRLRAAGFRTAQLNRSVAAGDFVLRGRLHEFAEVDPDGAGPEPLTARLALELDLVAIETGAVAWTSYYTDAEPVSSDGVEGVVRALDRNVARALDRLVGELVDHFAEQG